MNHGIVMMAMAMMTMYRNHDYRDELFHLRPIGIVTVTVVGTILRPKVWGNLGPNFELTVELWFLAPIALHALMIRCMHASCIFV